MSRSDSRSRRHSLDRREFLKVTGVSTLGREVKLLPPFHSFPTPRNSMSWMPTCDAARSTLASAP